MSITARQLNTVDLAVGGTSSSPTKTYTGVAVQAVEPSFAPIAQVREFIDGSVDLPASHYRLTWKVVFDKTVYPDTDTGVAALEKVLAFFANRPQFFRANTAEWFKRHGDFTTWIKVVALGDLPTTRESNLYGVEFTVQEVAPISITPP